MYLGIDIGGTFTDLVLIDDGTVTSTKAPTTPGELEVGLFDAISQAASSKGLGVCELLSKVVTFGHGTTQATNALIERDGAATGLITTRGFGDTLSLQRLQGFNAGVPVDRLGWYSRKRYPAPIVPRHLVEEVSERVDLLGRVILDLDEQDVRQAIERLLDKDVQAFAVALLWSFRNPAHEARIGEIIHEMAPDAYISLSSETAPVIGEYERTATTALNSYLSLKVVEYLRKVDSMLRDHGFAGNFYVLNSSGGVMPAADAADKPVSLVMSGPTGGVMGSLELAKAQGFENVITTDMGGTSFDVALIVDGKPIISATHEAGGFHLNTPVIDIRAIGAGGGSIARVDNQLLEIGPESANARPGPVCYGQGGQHVTVTDADVVLGILDPENFLGGRMKLDRAAAEAAVRDQIAKPLGVSVEKAAASIRRIVDAKMADTLREVTIGRGFDPRDFVLLAYGGAGPVHCTGFGAELGVDRILVPATSMGHCAYGALASDIHHTAEHSARMSGPGRRPWEAIDAAEVGRIFERLEQTCLCGLSRAGVAADDVDLVRTVDLRYKRQAHDLLVQFPVGDVTPDTLRLAVERFEHAYEGAYGKGSAFQDAGIEFNTFRVEGIGSTNAPAIQAPTVAGQVSQGVRRIFEPNLESWVDASIWQWLELPVDQEVIGPAVIEHPETAVYLGAGQAARLDPAGNFVIDKIEVQA